MKFISIGDLAGAVLEQLPRDAAPSAEQDRPCTGAHPFTAAAVVLDHRTRRADIRPLVVTDFYEGRP